MCLERCRSEAKRAASTTRGARGAGRVALPPRAASTSPTLGVWRKLMKQVATTSQSGLGSRNEDMLPEVWLM